MCTEHFLLSLLNLSIDFTPEISHPLSISFGHYSLYYQSSFLRNPASHRIVSQPGMSIETLRSSRLPFSGEASRDSVSCTPMPFSVLSADKVDFYAMFYTSHRRQIGLVLNHNTVLWLSQHKYKDSMSNKLLRSKKIMPTPTSHSPQPFPPQKKKKNSLPPPLMFSLNNV